jgi:hypothetical protein
MTINPEVSMKLAESVRKLVLKNLPYRENDPGVIAALNRMGPGNLLTLYLNWRDRLIPTGPRRVLRSAVFNQNSVVSQRALAISQIIDDIEHGRDLTKYLSRHVKIGFELPPKPGTKKLKRLKYLDLLLNDWGIHHLHISTIVESDSFVQRNQHDDHLLFAIFKPERAYLIDVMRHGNWANEHLLRTIIDTWPDDGLVREVKGIRGSRRTFGEEERIELRSAGISELFQIDGRVYSSGTAITTAGNSIKTTFLSNRILRALKHFQEEVNADPTQIIQLIRQHGGIPLDKPDFEFSFFQDGFGVIEKTTGFAIRLLA